MARNVYCVDCEYYGRIVYDMDIHSKAYCGRVQVETITPIQHCYELGNPYTINCDNQCPLYQRKLSLRGRIIKWVKAT